MIRAPHLNFRTRIAAAVWGRRLAWVGAGVVLAFGLANGEPWLLLPVLVFVFVLEILLRRVEGSLRRQFIREAALPSFLVGKLCEAHPHLTVADAELVLRGLRQFFLAYLRSGRKFVAMPSQVVDTAWHAFILHTQAYERWSRTAFGGMLHHSPAEVLGRDRHRNEGLRRTWFWACKEENIQPGAPVRLPLLFALDTKLAIEGGFDYAIDGVRVRRAGAAGAAHAGIFSDAGGAIPADGPHGPGCGEFDAACFSGDSGGGGGGDSGGCGGGSGCGGGGGGGGD